MGRGAALPAFADRHVWARSFEPLSIEEQQAVVARVEELLVR
jgi:hypothetical protein